MQLNANKMVQWMTERLVPKSAEKLGYVLDGKAGATVGKYMDKRAEALMSGDLAQIQKSGEQLNRMSSAAIRARENRGILKSAGNVAAIPGRYVNESIQRKAYGEAALRAGAVGAGWVGANGILKSATVGGGMFADSQGDFDIAGIPFI